VLSVFFNLDFLFAASSPEIKFLEQPLVFSESDLEWTYLVYTFLFCCTISGFVVFHLFDRLPGLVPEPPSAETLIDLRQSSAAIMLIALLASLGAVAIFLRYGEVVLIGAETFQIFARENRFFVIALFLLLPSYSLFLSIRRPWQLHAILVTALTIGLVSFSGTRSLVIFVLLVVGLASISNGVRIPLLPFYLVATPIIAGFLVVGRYARESFLYSGFPDFLQARGGVFELFFGSASTEASVAKCFSVAILHGENLERGPFTSLIGMLMYPLPRDIFQFKPLGASSEFTQKMAPLRWLFTGSEVTITGYADLVLSLGVFGAGVVLFFLSFCWLRACTWAINAESPWNTTALAFLIWFMFNFLRSDLYVASSFMWSFVVIIGGYWFLMFFRKEMREARRRSGL
jgi:hypothetical protein